TILDCKLALCHLASDMKYAGAVYEARTYGSVRGMRRKPHPTRCMRVSSCNLLTSVNAFSVTY
ncbi:MAG: hypothetical protein VXW48_09825, partial [Pseudomonadota bacterium]|nr:hypothetical protein [Pseudomonadota bacterium]